MRFIGPQTARTHRIEKAESRHIAVGPATAGGCRRAVARSLTPDLRIAYNRRRADAFFGLKLDVRRDKVGVFAKVRPGFTRLTEAGGEQNCAGTVCPLVLLIRPEYRTEFGLDVGGVLEFYPSMRTVARFELGDTLIRHRSLAPPCWLSNCTSHNLSSRLGVGLRF
jgi:hypothetical protein